MTQSTFNRVIDDLLTIEGGFSNRPTKADPGGPTKNGITLETFRAWRGKPHLSSVDLEKIEVEEVIEIYRSQFWNTVRGDDLPTGVDWAVFDFSVNSGPGRAVLTLQELLQVKQDGIIGVMTLSAIKSYSGGEFELIANLSDARLQFMKTLQNWPYNKNGWTQRVKKVKDDAQTMVFASADYRPDMAKVPSTPKASSHNMNVSKAFLAKENIALLTVAIPAISGLLSDFQSLQYVLAAFIAGFGSISSYRAYRRVRKEAV